MTTDAGRVFRDCGAGMRAAFSVVRLWGVDEGVGDLRRHSPVGARDIAVSGRRRDRAEAARRHLTPYRHQLLTGQGFC